jgi:AcrR family transcriptional regulator
MTTEAKFKYALKEMMLSHPLEDINVTVLCEKCECHRQTFYYHYQDIYDLLAAIFLNERIEGLDQASDVMEALGCFLGYAKSNFVFLRSTCTSSAHDLVDDFFYGKITTKLFDVLSKKDAYGLSRDGYRAVARRYAKTLSDELGYGFRDISITPSRFERNMKSFFIASYSTVFPAFVALSKEGKTK